MEKLTDLTNKSADFKYHYGLGWIDCDYTWKMKIIKFIEELENQVAQFIEDRENKHTDKEIIYARDILEKLLEDTNE